MPTPAQAGAAVATAGVLSAGSYGIYHYTTSSEDGKKEVTKTVTTYADGAIDQQYNTGVLSIPSNKDKLVKTLHQDNKDWWNKVFNDRLKGNTTGLTTDFSKVQSGYGAEATALNQTCDKAYKVGLSDLKGSQSALKTDIEKFCTLNPGTILSLTETTTKKPTTNIAVFSDTLTGNDYTNQKIIGILKGANRNKFVKPIGNSGDNTEKWWTWSFKERFNKRGIKPLHATFSSVDSHYSTTRVTTPTTAKQTALNQACDDAYKLDKDKYEEQHLLDNLKDFCALEVEATTDLKEPVATTHTATTTETDTNYKQRLLSAGTNKDKLVKDHEDNKYWWKWAYSKRVNDQDKANYPAPFNGLTTYGSDSKSINKACDAAYKKVKNQVDDALLTKVKDLCSVNPSEAAALTKPATDVDEPSSTAGKEFLLKGATVYKSAFAKNANNQSKLVDPSKGEEWWKWSFENRFPVAKTDKDKLPVLFQSVTEGYKAITTGETITGNPTSLNKACKVAYEKEKSDISAAATGQNKNLLTAIKDLCAIKTTNDLETPDPTALNIKKVTNGHTPKQEYKTTGVGAKSENQEKLADPDTDDNKEWWNERFRKLPADKASNSSLSALFQKVTVGYKSPLETTENTVTSLNGVCHLAYSKDKAALGTDGKMMNNIKAYCAIKENDNDIQEPQS